MTTEAPLTVQLTRTFRASPEEVFDSFLVPDRMRKWFLTTEATNRSVTNETRVHGTWETVDHRDGVDYRAIGEYLALDRPRRLEFTLQMPQFGDSTDTIEVELAPSAEGSRLDFTQRCGVPVQPEWTPQDVENALDRTAAGARRVWNTLFDRLAQSIEPGTDRT